MYEVTLYNETNGIYRFCRYIMTQDELNNIPIHSILEIKKLN